MYRPILRIAAAVAIVAVLPGCELVNNEDQFTDPTLPVVIQYSTSVQPVLEQRCTSCHGAATAEGGLRLDSWQAVVAGSDLAAAVVPFDANRSRLIRMITDTASPHPADVGGDSLSADDIETLRLWIDRGARNDARTVPNSNLGGRLFVTDPDDATVSIIDVESMHVIRIVDLVEEGFPPSARPTSIATEPDGSAWYVSLTGANTVARFDQDNRLSGQTTFVAPGPLLVHPTEDLLYVSRDADTPNPPLSVGKIDRESMSLTLIPVVFPRPHSLALHPSGEFVFAGSFGQNQLTRIAVSTDSVSFVPVGGPTHGMLYAAVSAGTNRMITTGANTNTLLVHDVADPDSVRLVGELPLNDAPTVPVFLPDVEVAYVPSAGTNSVARVTLSPLSVERVILGDGIAGPAGIVTAGAETLFLANRNPPGAGEYTPRRIFSDNSRTGTVVVIDVSTNAVVRVIEVGTSAHGVAVTTPAAMSGSKAQ